MCGVRAGWPGATACIENVDLEAIGREGPTWEGHAAAPAPAAAAAAADAMFGFASTLALASSLSEGERGKAAEVAE